MMMIIIIIITSSPRVITSPCSISAQSHSIPPHISLPLPIPPTIPNLAVRTTDRSLAQAVLTETPLLVLVQTAAMVGSAAVLGGAASAFEAAGATVAVHGDGDGGLVVVVVEVVVGGGGGGGEEGLLDFPVVLFGAHAEFEVFFGDGIPVLW